MLSSIIEWYMAMNSAIILSINLLVKLLMAEIILIISLFLIIKWIVKLLPKGNKENINIGFFHPYCNAGGGGERVLWCAVRSIQRKYPNAKCYIYTGDTDATSEEITRKAGERFNVVLPRPVEFIFLRLRQSVEAKNYPVFTLLLQSLGAIFLGMEAMCKLNPDIYIDTMGYAFTYPLFKYVAGSKVVSYTHYPTISTDMLSIIENRVEAHNNRPMIAKSRILSLVKVFYYYIFTFFYFLAGYSADVVMVNSTWTFNHIDYLWRRGANTKILYPPCDTTRFKTLPLQPSVRLRKKLIVSIGQFRPEKDHALQIRSLSKVLSKIENHEKENIKLVLIGGCRNAEDEARVANLKILSSCLGVEDYIIWKLNAPFIELLEYLRDGVIGIHTMWNEHFGIGIVESMAAGLVMLAHNSGGPKLDIIQNNNDQVGFLASNEDEYCEKIISIFRKTESEIKEIQQNARASVGRFSDENFEEAFLNHCESVFT